MIMKSDYLLITAALPYANGPLHIGHIAGAYLPADIFSRFKKMQENTTCIFLSGIDAHGVALFLQAIKSNMQPKDILEINEKKIIRDFSTLNIHFDYFGTTHDPLHFETAKKFFQNLYENNYIEKRLTKKYFCEIDQVFLPDRYLKGDCPKCLAKKARGDECTKCGEWIKDNTILNPICQLCETSPVFRENEEYFFLFSKFESKLKYWLSNQKDMKEEARNFGLGKIQESIIDRSISRELDWGIPIPNNFKSENTVMYVWFEAVICYISLTIKWGKEIKKNSTIWEKFWKNPDSKIYHFIGKDNLIFHTLFFPSILMGQKDNFNLPYNICVNSHLTVNGEKISTSSSKNTRIWIEDFLLRFPSDYLRYYLTIISPEKKDSDFNWTDFKDRINQDLSNNLGNLIHRTFKFIQKNYSNYLPKTNIVLDEEDLSLVKKIENISLDIEKLLNKVELKKALVLIFHLSQLGNQYFDKEKPWVLYKTNSEKCIQKLKIVIFLIKHLTIMLSPFLPDLTKNIYISLNEKEKLYWKDIKEININNEIKIRDPKPLIKKIEVNDIP